ncbi:MAG: ABC transporter permease [Granulosicoccus sp.]
MSEAMLLDKSAARFKPMQRVLLLGVLIFALLSLALLAIALLSGGTRDDGTALFANTAVVVRLFLVSTILLAVVWLSTRVMDKSRYVPLAVISLLGSSVAAFLLLSSLDTVRMVPIAYWLNVMAAWLLAWACVEQLASIKTRMSWYQAILNVLIPLLFGVWLLLLWEILVRGLNIPQVLLPAPSVIGQRFGTSASILWADFQQTFLRAVLIGYVIGCGAGFIVAVLIDRSPFLKRGLLPIGNLVSALPIVGVAPIMVMWFGFDWPSKAAVVVIMTFFPMLVNTVAGLSAAQPMQLDLMKTYAASYWQNLLKLRIPEALPFIFNALKINSTLAMIGAIVAEFFGTPTVGMGFRISTEVGRMNVDMVWAEIAVAAVAGSLFYGAVALAERKLTFWHSSNRHG